MLGTRTKQVNAYGKRSKRVVDVSASNPWPEQEILRIIEDLPSPPAWAPVASRMKGRENATPKQKVPAPKVVGMQRKRRLSPVLSPIKKPQRVSQPLKEIKVPSRDQVGVQQKDTVQLPPLGGPSGMFNSPPRAPLSSVSVNTPGTLSLAPTARKMKRRAPSTKATSKERRLSRTRAEPKSCIVPQSRKQHQSNSKLPIYVDSASESERPKRLKKRAARVIVVDNSESDDEAPAPLVIAPNPGFAQKPSGSKHSERTLTVEVIIPPAPYSTREVPRLCALPNVDPPKTHPKPRAYVIPTREPAFKLPASPIFKGRQLTPIHGGRKRGLFEPALPPSPSPSDLELSFDLADLSLYSEDISGISFAEQSIPEYLKLILEECHQEDSGPHDFSSFIESFPFDSILQPARDKIGGELTFKKIGEASYSEVFGIGDVVLKVIPLRDESPDMCGAGKQHTLKLAARGTQNGEDLGDDAPPPSDAQDVRKEIIVTRAMGEVHHGFVKLLKTYIVKGKYPEILLNLWDEYDDHKGSENIRPATFSLSQAYAIIVLPNGGPDLEAYSFSTALKSGWRQASSVFWQVAKSLAHAEQLVSFEHRDLHWGQILVNNVRPQKPKLKPVNLNSMAKTQRNKVVAMDDLDHGVRVTIIDLGLSRMDAGDGSDDNRVQWTPFDKEIFMGEGDYQFDVYRMMRKLTGGEWEGYHPMTNVMWLHYLLTKLLRSKGLKPPSAARKAKGVEASPAEVAGFSEKDSYECLVVLEQWLGQTLIAAFPAEAKTNSVAAKGKGRRAREFSAPLLNHEGPVSAGEIVEYGVKKSWIRASALY